MAWWPNVCVSGEPTGGAKRLRVIEDPGVAVRRLGSGVAVVKYDCDGLTLLRDCQVPGSYGFLAMGRKKEAVKLNDADETRTTLPLGGLKMIASFKAEIETGLAVGIVHALGTRGLASDSRTEQLHRAGDWVGVVARCPRVGVN